MSNLTTAEVEARRHFLEWFLYFRQSFYVDEGKPDRKFAADLGISPSYITQVRSGDRGVGFDVALRMRHFFKRNLDELAFSDPPRFALQRPPSQPERPLTRPTRRMAR
jgi:transcriptional regulator with XRE-family HTH domain